ncbi:hypothetical protein J7E45_10350 [Microbacterium sp. ISL-59]|uniref:hypothetical protein n=1 Tax=Microbacterium sp. ISL-59 TaxID=2819159 RepID=UPI001BE8B9A8|nr:hypothetical protein [Microbacterium sp. ISL-59]MBT2496008.1 hypothetical protein [Microbacterium sp. ISL-59]
MSEEAWRPVIPTGREDALTEEFPSYLREALFRWMARAVNEDRGYVYRNRFIDFQNAARTDLGFRGEGLLSWDNQVLPSLRKLDDATFTNLLDYLASTTHFAGGASEHPLEKPLSDGGSAWTVTRWHQTKARLVKRVSDGVRKALGEALSGTDAASSKLQEAWLDAYGTNPRASVAYSHAVVAVETAALSVIPVGGPDPTLANLFSILEAETPKWRLVLRDSPKAPGAKSLAMMLRTIWRGHESRHGRPDYADATLEEARAAVILAATLVQWFTSGVVVPVVPSPISNN